MCSFPLSRQVSAGFLFRVSVDGFCLKNELPMLPWLLLMTFATVRPSLMNTLKISL